MNFLNDLKRWFGDKSKSTARQSNPLFVYIKIPAELDPQERGELFEDPLQEAMDRENVGTVTGGGSLLSAPDEEGQRTIEYCGIDIDLYDPGKGLALLRRELIRLKAPAGTLLLYELDGQDWEEPVYRMES